MTRSATLAVVGGDIRQAHLADDGPVFVFHRRMQDALGMDQHLDLFQGNVKKPPGFHDLQAFIHHSRRIDGNLMPHAPVCMF